MNNKIHKASGPAFNKGEVWVSSSGSKVIIISVTQYANTSGKFASDYDVTYVQTDPSVWSFQTRYNHIADINL